LVCCWYALIKQSNENERVPYLIIPLSQDLIERQVIRLLPLGDSITEGFPPCSSYRVPLWNALQKKLKEDNLAFSFDFVGSRQGPGNWGDADMDHEGHSGTTTESIRNNMEKCITTYKPDIILIHIGTNDLGWAWHEDSVEETLTELSELIDIISLHPDCKYVKVFVAQIIGSRVALRVNDYEFTRFVKNGVYHPLNEDVNAYNKGIKELVARKNSGGRISKPITNGQNITAWKPIFPISVVDMNTRLMNDSNYRDSLHPSCSGEEAMGLGWFESLIASDFWASLVTASHPPLQKTKLQ